MANARDKAERAEQDSAEPSEVQADAAAAGESTATTTQGGGDSDKPKRTRTVKTFEQKVEEMRVAYEERESKRKARILREVGEVEDKIGKLQSKLIELTTERNDLRASIGLLPEAIGTPAQGPDDAEILADPVAAGDTTAADNLRS